MHAWYTYIICIMLYAQQLYTMYNVTRTTSITIVDHNIVIKLEG